MAKPFISFDGSDDRGIRAEVFVEVGSGPVTAIEGLAEGKRNVRVVIEPAQLTRPVYGWVQSHDPILEIAKAALASGEEVRYRVESQRRNGVDREIPIQKLRENANEASKQVSRILAALNGSPSLEAVTNPAEDPSVATGRIPATQAATSPSPAATSGDMPTGNLNLAEAVRLARQQQMDPAAIDVLTALAVASGIDLPATPHSGTDSSPADLTGGTRPREEPPYALTDSDGQPNIGSYAVTGAVYLLDWASQQFGPIPDGDPAAIAAHHDRTQALAGLVMAMADQVQVTVRGGGRPQRNASSHTAARRLLCSLMETDGLPLGQPRPAIDAWINRTTNTAIRRFQAAVAILRSSTSDLYQAADATPPNSDNVTIHTTPLDTMVDVPAGSDPLADIDMPESVDDMSSTHHEDLGTPTQDPMDAFIGLAIAAGFAENKEPVGIWLQQTWGVTSVTKLSPDDLELIIDQYSGPEGAAQFHGDVMGVATASIALGSLR